MKFDYIVGNPPYQYPEFDEVKPNKKLWRDITIRMFSKSPDISFVTPNSICTLLSNKYYKDIKYFDYQADSYFDVGVLISAWRYKLGNTEEPITIDEDGTKHVSRLFRQREDQPFFDIEQKLKDQSKKHGYLFKEEKEEYQTERTSLMSYKMYVNLNKGKICYSRKSKDFGKKRLAISESMAYKSENFIYTTKTLGPLQKYIVIEDYTKDQLQQLQDFLSSEIVIKLVKRERQAKKTGFFAIDRHFSVLEDKDYTIAKNVKDTLGLSDEDVAYILSTE